jgi:hypothetical protein
MMSSARTLKNDASGAVMVFGVFGAVLLVGVLYYLIGVGDAIVHRESLQDAADATAYTGAVYHARGMNLIAMINLTMAAVLSVLVALKLVQLLLLAIWGLSCLCVALSVGVGVPCDAVCAGMGSAMMDFEMLVVNVGGVITCVLQALHLDANAVAMFTPWVAAAHSGLQATQEYGSTIDFGLAVSYSMVPGQLTRDIAGSAINGSSALNNSGALGAARAGLAGAGKAAGDRLGGSGAGAGLSGLANRVPSGVRDLAGRAGAGASGLAGGIGGLANKAGLGTEVGVVGTQLDKAVPGLGGAYSKIGKSGLAGQICSAVLDLVPDSKTGVASTDESATGRIGLPVQADDFQTVCRVASQDAIDILSGSILDNGFFLPGPVGQNATPILKYMWAMRVVGNDINHVLATVLASFSWHFCEGFDLTGLPYVNTLLSFLESAATAVAACVTAEPQDFSKCTDHLKKVQKNVTTMVNEAMDIGAAITDASRRVKHYSSFKLYDGANNDDDRAKGARLGSDFFAVWAGVYGSWNSNAQRGVSIATWGKQKVSDPGPQTAAALAETEFYFDKHGKAGVTVGPKDVGQALLAPLRDPYALVSQHFPDDAMWNMRWRARLRRICSPSANLLKFGDISQHLEDGLTNGLLSIADKTLGDAGAVAASPLIGKLVDWLVNHADIPVTPQQSSSLPGPLHGAKSIPVWPGYYTNMANDWVKGMQGSCREGSWVH